MYPAIEVIISLSSRGVQKVQLNSSPCFKLSLQGEKTHSQSVKQWVESYLQKEQAPLPPLDWPELAPFSRQVLEELTQIPFGSKISYGTLAKTLERPKAARAVGRACHVNPFALLVPCHRVVAQGGDLRGFAYGVELKKALLAFESI